MQTHPEEALEGPLGMVEARTLSPTPPEPVTQTVVDVVVHLVEFVVCVAGPKVVAPATQHGVELRNDIAQLGPGSSPTGHLVDAAAHTLHRFRGRPALQERPAWVAQDRSFLAQRTSQKLEAAPPSPQVDHLRLVRVELEAKQAELLLDQPQSCLRLPPRRAQHDEVIRVPHQLPEVLSLASPAS